MGLTHLMMGRQRGEGRRRMVGYDEGQDERGRGRKRSKMDGREKEEMKRMGMEKTGKG